MMIQIYLLQNTLKLYPGGCACDSGANGCKHEPWVPPRQLWFAVEYCKTLHMPASVHLDETGYQLQLGGCFRVSWGQHQQGVQLQLGVNLSWSIIRRTNFLSQGTITQSSTLTFCDGLDVSTGLKLLTMGKQILFAMTQASKK